MTDEQQAGSRLPQGDNGENPLSALESAQSYLATSAGSGGEVHGSGKAFTASFATLLDWGEATGLILQREQFSFFTRQPDGFGDEHQAWFEESHNRWFKSTYPNKFGLAWGRNGTATASEYLYRLVLQNEYFGPVRGNAQRSALHFRPRLKLYHYPPMTTYEDANIAQLSNHCKHIIHVNQLKSLAHVTVELLSAPLTH